MAVLGSLLVELGVNTAAFQDGLDKATYATKAFGRDVEAVRPQHDAADYGWGKGGARVVYFADGQPQGLRNYKSQSTGVANLAGRYAAAMALLAPLADQA